MSDQPKSSSPESSSSSSTNWASAAEFVPTWFTGKKSTGSSEEKNTTTTTDNGSSNNKKNTTSSSSSASTSAKTTSELRIGATPFVPSFQKPATATTTKPASKQPHGKKSQAPASKPSGKKKPSHSNASEGGGKQQHQQQPAGKKSSSSNQKKISPQMGSQSGSWVTPPMAPLSGPGGSSSSTMAAGDNNNDNSSNKNNNNSSKHGSNDLLLPPSMDLGDSALSSPDQATTVKEALDVTLKNRGLLVDDDKKSTTTTTTTTTSASSSPGKKTGSQSNQSSSRSKMSASADVFMPAGFVAKTRANVQAVIIPKTAPTISGISRKAAAADSNETGNTFAGAVGEGGVEPRHDLSLMDTWCLYFDDAVKKSEQEFDPYLICHMSDVPTFWRVLQNVPPVSRQNDGTNYYLFREGIVPKWEDERNTGGGAWTLKFHLLRSSDIIDATWERLCCQIVGENWSEDIRPTINGLVAKIRPRSVTFQVWVSKKINMLLPQLQDRALSDTVAASIWDYVAHPNPAAAAASSSSSAGAAAAAAASGTTTNTASSSAAASVTSGSTSGNPSRANSEPNAQ